MRLQRYISEAERLEASEIAGILKRDCKFYFKESRNANGFLYRASRKRVPTGVLEVKTRKDRRPLDTPQELHEIWNKEFKKKFGWNARSEGAFATSLKNLAEGFFGNVYLFFPIGRFKYVWSPAVDDLANYIDTEIFQYFKYPNNVLKKRWAIENREDLTRPGAMEDFEKWREDNYTRIDKEIKEEAAKVIELYKDKDLKSAIERYGGEVSFKCDSYYLVSTMYGDELESLL